MSYVKNFFATFTLGRVTLLSVLPLAVICKNYYSGWLLEHCLHFLKNNWPWTFTILISIGKRAELQTLLTCYKHGLVLYCHGQVCCLPPGAQLSRLITKLKNIRICLIFLYGHCNLPLIKIKTTESSTVNPWRKDLFTIHTVLCLF